MLKAPNLPTCTPPPKALGTNTRPQNPIGGSIARCPQRWRPSGGEKTRSFVIRTCDGQLQGLGSQARNRLLRRAFCWIQWRFFLFLNLLARQSCGVLRGSLRRQVAQGGPWNVPLKGPSRVVASSENCATRAAVTPVATPILTSRTTTSFTPSPRTPDAVFTLVRGRRTETSTSGAGSWVKCGGELACSVARWFLCK